MNSPVTNELPRLLYTIEEASIILGGMSEATIRKHVHCGNLQRCALGKKPWYFTIDQLKNFIHNTPLEARDERP